MTTGRSSVQKTLIKSTADATTSSLCSNTSTDTRETGRSGRSSASSASLRTSSGERLNRRRNTSRRIRETNSSAALFMRNLKRKKERQPEQHNYPPKRLPFRTPLNGISDRALKNHHDKLYAGYVEKKNEIENRLGEVARKITGGAAKG